MSTATSANTINKKRPNNSSVANTVPAILTARLPSVLPAISIAAGLFSMFFSWLIRAGCHIDIPKADSLNLLRIVQINALFRKTGEF
jgi:hypothetical protein